MTPHAIHLRIARVLVDGSVADADGVSRDPARLAAAIAARVEGEVSMSGGRAISWPGAIASALGSRLVAVGVLPVGTGGQHGRV